MKIFKVFYQENSKEVPVRENTEVLYVEADSIPKVYKYIEERKFNIEYIQELSEKHLEFEKNSVNFKLEKING